jgi:hypothetical protein
MNALQPIPGRIRSVADLRSIQQAMAGALMQPLTRQDRLRPGTGADYLRGDARLGGLQRLEIYARQYWFRLLDCLYDDFPALRALLGGKRFMRLCENYLAAHPSTSWTLRDLGARLPAFITDPAARDVARVEWAQALAFDEALLPAVPAEVLAAKDPAELRLALQPCALLLRLDHAADLFIMALGKETSDSRSTASQSIPGRPAKTATKRRPRLEKEDVHLVVHRQDCRLYLKRLEPEPWRLLAALRDGLPLARALELALEGVDAAARDWPAEVRRWFHIFGQMNWLTLPRAKTHPIHRP